MPDWNVDIASSDGSVAEELIADLASVVEWTLTREEAGDVELSFALMDDDAISVLNQEYLSHEGPTDVISFPLEQPGLALVGDIYIGHQQAARQAAEHGVTTREELLRLAVHGTLHVLGWEHFEEGDRAEMPMYKRQEEILASFLSRG